MTDFRLEIGSTKSNLTATDADQPEQRQIEFFTRSGLDWLNRFAFIKDGLEALPPDIIIDGEVVSVEPDGRTNFSQLRAD